MENPKNLAQDWFLYTDSNFGSNTAWIDFFQVDQST